MMRRVLTALVVFVSLGWAPAQAESPWANVADPVFQRIDLSPIGNPGIYAIAQDAQGFLWIGTPTGLWRYDGYDFRSFTAAQDGPAPPNVESLADDGHGSLWIGTQSGGLERFDEKTETFQAWSPDPKGRRGPRSATIIALAPGQNGTWWIGGDSGLDTFAPATQTFVPVRLGTAGRAATRVEAIHVDRRQTVWVGTVRGLFYRTAGESQFRPLRLGSSDRAAVFSLYEDRSGRMWVGSLNALYVVSAQGRVVRSYASSSDAASLLPGEQWAIAEGARGEYWIGSGDGGISIVNAATQRVRRVVVDRANPGSLTPGQIWQFFRDRSGLLWVVNDTGGLLSYNPGNRGVYQLPSYDHGLGLGTLGTRSVAAGSDGSLWVGGADRVVHVDPGSGIERYRLDGNVSVQALHVDENRTLWIGTARGLCRLPSGAAAVECPSGTPARTGRVLTLIHDGPTLWIGTDSGVVAWDTRKGSVVRYRHSARTDSLSNDYVEALYEDLNGNIWAGTANGLNRIDPNLKTVTRFENDPNDASSLGPGQVPAITEDDDGNLWAAAEGGPLNLLIASGDRVAIRRLGTVDGLPENVTGLEPAANGAIWASVSDALVRIDSRTLHATTLGPADGVLQSHFWPRPARASNGTVFFAGTYSVVVLTPGGRAPWNFAPPVVVTAVQAGDQSVPLPEALNSVVELPSSDRQLSVEFAALDYSAPQALRYEYRLDGYDRAWMPTDAEHRVATYTNLAPGNYTLFVRATNHAGEWSPNVVALHVRAIAAWYETWWFRVLLAMVGIAAIVAVVRGRTEILRRRAERLEKIVDERTFELAQANASLEKMTVTDPLTGLHNRRFLTQRIGEDVALALRQKSDLVFFIVDIDHFKAVNDELGHAAGDRVLAQMRERLESVFRASDYVLRWGGEEFLAVTRAATRDDAPEIAERLRKAIAEKAFTIGDGQYLLKTASIGFAAFPFVKANPEALSWEQVVALADQALYRAKNGGRNAWFGLTATEKTDPGRLASILMHSPEAAVENCGLIAVTSQHLRV